MARKPDRDQEFVGQIVIQETVSQQRIREFLDFLRLIGPEDTYDVFIQMANESDFRMKKAKLSVSTDVPFSETHTILIRARNKTQNNETVLQAGKHTIVSWDPNRFTFEMMFFDDSGTQWLGTVSYKETSKQR